MAVIKEWPIRVADSVELAIFFEKSAAFRGIGHMSSNIKKDIRK